MQPAEIQFAQRLASHEKGIRDRAVKKLRQYISVKTQKETGSTSKKSCLPCTDIVSLCRREITKRPPWKKKIQFHGKFARKRNEDQNFRLQLCEALSDRLKLLL